MLEERTSLITHRMIYFSEKNLTTTVKKNRRDNKKKHLENIEYIVCISRFIRNCRHFLTKCFATAIVKLRKKEKTLDK